MLSVEQRELSITHSIDYTAKTIRDTVSPLVGKVNITPAFITTFQKAVQAAGNKVVEEGNIGSVTVLETKQDPNQGDQILCKVRLGLLYPFNYADITLIF